MAQMLGDHMSLFAPECRVSACCRCIGEAPGAALPVGQISQMWKFHMAQPEVESAFFHAQECPGLGKKMIWSS